MTLTTQALARSLGARLIGNGEVELSSVAAVAAATAADLIFVEDRGLLPAALASGAGAILAGEFAVKAKAARPLLLCSHPRLAFARAARLLRPAPAVTPGIHPSAVVAATARLGRQVGIGPHARLGEDCALGDHTIIGANCFIGAGVRIGSDCRIAPNVTIYPGVTLGDRVMVQAGAVLGSAGFGYVRDPASGRYEPFPQMGTLEIGNDVEIGANSTLDRGALAATIIHDGVKIDNLVHIAHNVEVGENVVIAAQTGISGSSVIESGAIIGGQVGIGDHARIEADVILGSGAGVLTKKVVRGKGIVFWGRPARPLRQYLKELAALARLAKK